MLNLWEMMHHARDWVPLPLRRKEEMKLLAARGSSGQELSVGSIAGPHEGWIIKVHSCYHDGEVVVLVPSDSRYPVEIVTDTRATARDYDRNSDGPEGAV